MRQVYIEWAQMLISTTLHISVEDIATKVDILYNPLKTSSSERLYVLTD